MNYTGVPLSYARQGRGISRRHFARFVAHLFDTLETFNLGERDRDEIVERIGTYVDEVVGGVGELG